MRVLGGLGFLKFALSVLALSVLACNGLTGADALRADGEPSKGGSGPSSGSSGTAGASGSSSGSSGTSGASGSSGAEPSDGGLTDPPGPVLAINETFEVPSVCTAAKTSNGATVQFEPNGVTGGACILCATMTGDAFLELTASAPKSGRASMDVYVRAIQPGGPSNASLKLDVAGSSSTVSPGIDTNWARFEGMSSKVKFGDEIVARVGMSSAAAGDCIAIDDLRVAIP